MSMTPMWRWPIERSHELAGTAGPLAFVGGAGDFDHAGEIRNPGDLMRQIEGSIENMAVALESEGCTVNDVVRFKAFYTPEGDADDWVVMAALAKASLADPMPAISVLPVPQQPFDGQRMQLQAIAQRGWRRLENIRVAERIIPLTKQDLFSDRAVTAGLRAGEFIAVSNRTAASAEDEINEPGDGAAQSHTIMSSHIDTLGTLGASLQDAIKMEGYYFGTTREQWAGMADARASHFREPGPVATVVPCHQLTPEGAMTKVEVMAMREKWNGFDKYIPREDFWPRRVWDWPIPLPYRQAIRLRDMIWLGGQVPFEPNSNTGRHIFVGDQSQQTRFTMSLIRDLLRGFHRTPADLKLLVCYFASDGSRRCTDAFLDTIADCIAGPLPPTTLVPQPHMHDPETTVEIWGVAQG